MTKSFTATTLLSVLQELEDGSAGAIDLRTKISSVLPGDFVLQDDYATKHATLEDALAHILGVASANFSYGGKGYTLRDAIQSLRYLPMSGELREKHEYLNMGYMVVQLVIETLTGKPVEESHHKHIWDPLGMSSTFFKLSDAQNAKNTLATGYTWDGLTKKLIVTPHTNDYPLIGGGGLISSIKDLTGYLQAVIKKTLPLDPSRQAELFKPRAIAEDGDDKHVSTVLYALGWNVSHHRGHRLVSHSGGISGFSSELAFFPDENWGFAILANADMNGYAAVQTIMSRLINDFLQVRPGDRPADFAKGDQFLNSLVEKYLGARKRLFPSVPEPTLPLALPLTKYAGSYFHPAYRTLDLEVAKPPRGVPVAEKTKEVLHCITRRLVDLTLDLEHVSGEHFIGWSDTETGNIIAKAGLLAQFSIGSDGNVEKWGIDIENIGRLIWFTKTG